MGCRLWGRTESDTTEAWSHEEIRDEPRGWGHRPNAPDSPTMTPEQGRAPLATNSIDGSLPGSSVPGILQARTLEWVAISFSNA